MGDFQGANGALDAQQLANVLACPAGGGAPPCVANLLQERGQVVADAVRHGEGQQLDVQPHRFGQGHGGDQLSATTLADLRGANRAGPDRGADLQAGVKRLAVLDAAMHLERLLRDTPAAALGGAGGGQQAIDHALERVALGPVPLGVEFLNVFARLGVERKPGDFPGLFVYDLKPLKPAC
ncbi:hypothetical protein D3C80_859190 [compost metagenome]